MGGGDKARVWTRFGRAGVRSIGGPPDWRSLCSQTEIEAGAAHGQPDTG